MVEAITSVLLSILTTLSGLTFKVLDSATPLSELAGVISSVIGCGASSVGALNNFAAPKPIAQTIASTTNPPISLRPIPNPALGAPEDEDLVHLPIPNPALGAPEDEPSLPGCCSKEPPGTLELGSYKSSNDSFSAPLN